MQAKINPLNYYQKNQAAGLFFDFSAISFITSTGTPMLYKAIAKGDSDKASSIMKQSLTQLMAAVVAAE